MTGGRSRGAVRGRTALTLLGLLLFVTHRAIAADPPPPTLGALEWRAFRYFYEQSDPRTGLTKDRAKNAANAADTYTVASVAATGYALAALPIGVERGWISRKAAYERTLTTLRFVGHHMASEHGFFYHFVDWRNGVRVWNCEVSSADTALFLLGAITAGEYWPGTDVQKIAGSLADRADWRWLQTEGGATPDAAAPAMGWRPESGWIPARYTGYNEASYLYWLGLGAAPDRRLTPAAWTGWTFQTANEEGHNVFGGPAPLFMAEMTPNFFDVRGKQDSFGRDWSAAWRSAAAEDRAYCAHHRANATYAAGLWGIDAGDSPAGYKAQWPADGHNDGTIAPDALLAADVFDPESAPVDIAALWRFRKKTWGRYGFADALNLGADWFDSDVIGIDVGRLLLAAENARSGLIWRLTGKNAQIRRGLVAAGFHAGGRLRDLPAK